MRILIVEDDPDLQELLQSILSLQYPSDSVNTLELAHEYLDTYTYDIILLDRNLMGKDIGLNLIAPAKVKNPKCGILVMSAYGSVIDKIEGLNLGADDYIEKPFDTDELMARINALSRRFISSMICFQEISIDMISHTVTRHKEPVALTKKEDAILFTLLSRMGDIVSRDEIIHSAYDHPENIASNTIDVIINSLRKKLKPELIKTVKTRGYIIEHPQS